MATTKFKGFKWNVANSRLDVYVNGTAAGYFDNAAPYLVINSGLTVAAGNLEVSLGDDRITAGNLRLGVVSAFGTTEPTSAAVFKQGTAPAGAITTSGGVFSNGTVMQKIIAAGTVSNIQT